MSHDLGAVVPLSITIYDSDGAPANATTVVLTITLPDQTTATPSITNGGPGLYSAIYPTTQAGRHSVRWVATGTNAGAYVDVFDVQGAAPIQIVSLADAKRHLNITTTTHDEELRSFIASATTVIEEHVGMTVARRTRVELVDSGHIVHLAWPPVISLTSLTPVLSAGTTHAVAVLDVDGPTGTVRRLDGAPLSGGPFRATYVAGMMQVPPTYVDAAKMIIAHLWETQRNTSGQRPAFGETETLYDPRMSYSIPRRALELLGPRRVLVG